MIEIDLRHIGNKLLTLRKKQGLTQMELAEAAGLSNRAYADIERGTVNMRVDTLLHICEALHVTPNEILLQAEDLPEIHQEELIARLNACTIKEKETALQLLSVFFNSLS